MLKIQLNENILITKKQHNTQKHYNKAWSWGKLSSYNNDLKYSLKLCKTYLAKNLSSGFLCIVAQKSDLGVFKLLWEQFD